MAGEIKKVQFSEGLNVATPADIAFTPADFVGIMPTTKGGTGVNGSATYPTSGAVATTADITAAFEGKKFKDPVLVATTGNITLSGEQTIDTILTSASRVLVKSQGTSSENGIYVSAAGPWSRASDANAWDELTSAIVAVGRGSQADTVWICTLDAGGTLGVDPVTWELRAGSGAVDLASDVFGVLPITNGGTGSGTALGGFDALSPGAVKGDLLTHDGATGAALGVGADGKVLVADSAETTGLKWGDVPAPLTTKGDLYTFNATVAARLPVGIDGKVLQANSAQATGLEWVTFAGGGDASFKLDSIAVSVLTILGGYIKLNDGRELATYDGSVYGNDISVALLTLFAAPVLNTTYYLYIDIDALGAEQTQAATGRKLYRIQQAQMVLTETKPESINRARYVPIGSVVGDSGTIYKTINFTTYAAKSHSNSPLAINPKVYTLSQAVGSVGSASQIKAGHILAAESFPSAMAASKVSFFNLAADALDDSANARNLTNNGSTAFTGTNIFGGASLAANLDGTNDNFSSINAHFNPGASVSFAFGGWFKATDWTPGSNQVLIGNHPDSSDRGFYVYVATTGIINLAVPTSPTTDAVLSIPNPGFSDGSWHHLAVVHDNTTDTWKFYIDGKFNASIVQNNRVIVAPIFRIGAYFTAASTFFTGAIEDCFFVNDYLLTDADIRKLYASKLAHGASVSAANQDWKFVLGSGVQKVPSISPVVDQTSSNTLYADFSDLDAAETVDIALLDMGMTAVAVPAVPPFDQTYTSNPSFPISHGLSEVPSLQVGYKDASNDWHWTTGEGAVKADSTQLKGSIQTYFDAAATHVRIRAVVGASPTGVKEATDVTSGLLQPVTSMSDALATTLGHKIYSHGTTYNGGNAPTITLTGGGGTLSSVIRGDFVPYKTQNGAWRCKLNIVVSLSSAARTNPVITVAGLVFAGGGTSQQISGGALTGGAAYTVYVVAIQNVGDINHFHASATTSDYSYSGDVGLSSKPTWAY